MFNGIGNRGFMSTTSLFNNKMPQQPKAPPMGDGGSLTNATTSSATSTANKTTEDGNTQSTEGMGKLQDPNNTNFEGSVGQMNVEGTMDSMGSKSAESVPTNHPVPPDADTGNSDGTSEPNITVKEKPNEVQSREASEAKPRLKDIIINKTKEKLKQEALERLGLAPEQEGAEGISMRETSSPPGSPKASSPSDPTPTADFKKKAQGKISMKAPKMAPKVSPPKIRMPRLR